MSAASTTTEPDADWLAGLWSGWGRGAARSIRLLTAQNGQHLRLQVVDAAGQTWLLRERPVHIPRADWRFPAELLARHADSAPALVPRGALTAAGEAMLSWDGRDFVLQQWLGGEPRMTRDGVDLGAAVEALGQVDAWVQAVPAASLPPRDQAFAADPAHPIRSLGFGGNPALNFGEAGGRLLAELPAGQVRPCHGDPHPFNFLWSDSGVGALVDWEDAHVNSVAWDLAYFLAHLTFIDWPRHDARGRGQEAWVRERPDCALTTRLVARYRAALGRPWPVDSGWRHALVRSLLVTVRLTVARAGVTEADMRHARGLLDWIMEAPEVDAWHRSLTQ